MIPDGQAKHPMQPFDAIHPIFFIGMNDCLCIAASAEVVSFCKQFLTQCLKVPDLSVEDSPDVSSFITHGLMTTA